MVYAKAFFDLQLQFAHKVTELSGLPFTRVLLEYTNLYIRFGLGRDFHPAHPIWQAYLAGLQDTNDQREWTYRFYLTRAEAMAGPPVVATFGCFSYALSRGNRIRLHFQNADTEGHSSLGIACLGTATRGPDRSLRARATDPARAGPGGGGVVAVQSRGVSSPVSGLIRRDSARGQ